MSFSLISSIFLVIKYTHIRNRMLIVCIENSKKIGNCQKFNRHHVVEVSTLTIGKHCMGHRFYFFFANGTIWILGVMENFRHQDPVMTIRLFYCTIQWFRWPRIILSSNRKIFTTMSYIFHISVLMKTQFIEKRKYFKPLFIFCRFSFIVLFPNY